MKVQHARWWLYSILISQLIGFPITDSISKIKQMMQSFSYFVQPSVPNTFSSNYKPEA